jgi:hypothetical protein
LLDGWWGEGRGGVYVPFTIGAPWAPVPPIKRTVCFGVDILKLSLILMKQIKKLKLTSELIFCSRRNCLQDNDQVERDADWRGERIDLEVGP